MPSTLVLMSMWEMSVSQRGRKRTSRRSSSFDARVISWLEAPSTMSKAIVGRRRFATCRRSSIEGAEATGSSAKPPAASIFANSTAPLSRDCAMVCLSFERGGWSGRGRSGRGAGSGGRVAVAQHPVDDRVVAAVPAELAAPLVELLCGGRERHLLPHLVGGLGHQPHVLDEDGERGADVVV